MSLDAVLDARSALDWYNVSALKTMLRARSDRWKDVRTKAESLAELRQCLYDPASIRRALATCDPLAIEGLALLRHKGGSMPAAALRGQLATWHPELGADAIYRVPGNLVRRALAFWHAVTPRYGGGSMHDVQRPAADNPLSALIYSAPEILEYVHVPPDLGDLALQPVRPVDEAEAPSQPLRRALSFLRAVEDRSPRVLRSGLIGSRDRAGLAQAIDLVGAELIGTPGSGGSNGSSGTSPVNFFRTTLGAAGYLEVSSELQLRTTRAALQFVMLPPVRQAQTLLGAWLDTGENELLNLGHLHCDRRANSPRVFPDDALTRHAYRCLVDLLRRRVRPGYWYRLADFSQAVRYADVEFLVSWRDPSPYRWSPAIFERDGYDAPTYVGITLEDSRGRSRALVMGADWDLVEGAFIRAVIQGPLSWLGIVEYHAPTDGPELFALTQLGAQVLAADEVAGSFDVTGFASQANSLIVQPNFDVVVYDPDQRTELLYQIDRFAERVSVDRLAIFHVSRDSLCSGLQLGLVVEDVIALLESSARESLPQNVTFSLRDWSRDFEQVRWLRNVGLLEAPDAETLDRWLADPQVQTSVDRRISPTMVLLKGAPSDAIRDFLARSVVDVRTVDANDTLLPSGAVLDDTHLSVEEPAHNFYLQSALRAIAEVVPSTGPDTVYEISPQSIQRAITSGLTAERILEILGRVVDGPVPAGLRIRVKGWAGVYQPVELGEVGILVASDADSLRELRADLDLAQDFIAVITPTSALVRNSGLERLRQALASRGVPANPYEAPTRARPDLG